MVKNSVSKFHLPSVAKYSRWHNVSSMYFESFESLLKITLSYKIRKQCDWQTVSKPLVSILNIALFQWCLFYSHENIEWASRNIVLSWIQP